VYGACKCFLQNFVPSGQFCAMTTSDMQRAAWMMQSLKMRRSQKHSECPGARCGEYREHARYDPDLRLEESTA